MTLEQIQKKIEYGDYKTLGTMLDLPPTTAKMRFLRGDFEAKEALETIIVAREKLITDYHKKESKA